MAMLEYNEIVPGKFVVMDGVPFECLTSHVFRKQQRKPVNHTKMRNLITGKVMEYAFAQTEKADQADLSTKEAKFLYANKGEFWFCNPKNPAERFQLSADLIGEKGRFLKGNMMVSLLIFRNDDDEEQTIGVKIPIKMELMVKEAPPNIRGNTAQGGNKQVTLETGAVINAPLFIEEGEIIRVNTDTGEYVERVGK